MDIRKHNRDAWDRNVERGIEWTIPVDADTIRRARGGDWKIILTPSKSVPAEWFPELNGADILCLASGGGQQGPILAASGARVTVFDNSPKQLEQDRLVAERESLSIETVEGDMTDLSAFSESRFDLIVHPVSNLFVPELHPVWRSAARVLKPGGALLSGFMNPAFFIFDSKSAEEGLLQVRHFLPYSDVVNLTDGERRQLIADQIPLEFSHSLDDQIGGQLEAGFVIEGFYEDRYPRASGDLLSRHMPLFMATRAVKRQ
jgi:SAM-dependent methyltransferase